MRTGTIIRCLRSSLGSNGTGLTGEIQQKQWFLCKSKASRDLLRAQFFRGYSTTRSLFSRSSPKSHDKVRVGVFGAGRVSSSVHIPNILGNHRIDLRWIVENNPNAIESLQSLVSTSVPFHNSDDIGLLLDDPSLEAVFVFTPTPTHFQLIKTCLEKGKAVFTEKPTAETLSDIEILYDTAKRVDRPLFTAYNRRFDPAHKDMFNMVVEGQLGKLHVAKITTRDSPKPDYALLRSMDQTGCNILSDLAVHDFDFLTWLTQSMAPESVYVMTHCHDPVMVDIGQPDLSLVVIQYPCGAMAMMDTARESTYGYDHRVELFGSLGMASSENPRQNFATRNSGIGALQRPMMYSFPQRFRDSFENEIHHFVDCVQGKASPLVTKEECLLTGLVMEAALESYRTGQAVNFPEFLTQRAMRVSTEAQ